VYQLIFAHNRTQAKASQTYSLLFFHLSPVELDLLVELGLDLLHRQLRRQTNVQLLPRLELEVLRVAQIVKYGALQRLINGHALSRVEHQRLVQEVAPLRPTIVKYIAGSLLVVFRQGFEVVEGDLLLNEGNLLRSR
jgi:hypothetical protein